MARTGGPKARAACRPVSTLTSCSGDGPPNRTATSFNLYLLCEVVRKIVLVKDCVAWPQVGPHPIHGRVSSPYYHHVGDPAVQTAEQGFSVRPPHYHHVGGHLAGRSGEGGVLLALKGSELHHSGSYHHSALHVLTHPRQRLQGQPSPRRVGVIGVVNHGE